MELTIENAGPYTCVRLYGRLDSRGSASIYDAVVELGSLGPGNVILQMEMVTHATRAGCRAIFVAARMLNARARAPLWICDASPEVQSMLLGAGHDHLLRVNKHSLVDTLRAA